MDIEKLIERLRGYCQEWEAYRRDQYRHDLEDTAAALSTLQAENEKLRAELEKVMRERDVAQSLLAERIGVRGAEPITTAFGLPLDRLRELAQADKLIGKTVWLTKWFTKNVQIANPPLQRTIRYISVCKNGEILMHLKDGAFPIQLIGDCAFTSQEEAKAALRREQDG